jgi:hypothetical protein
MTAPEVDLNFLAQQLERILTESEMCREDMAALIALTARVSEAKMRPKPPPPRPPRPPPPPPPP